MTAVSSMKLLRLLQLSSPQLPVGSYTFSQGLEWAVSTGWVANGQDFAVWLTEQLSGPVTLQELPILHRLQDAFARGNRPAVIFWSHFAVSCRETSELRAEERDRALAFFRVLQALSVADTDSWSSELTLTPLASVAFACSDWDIPVRQSLEAFAFTWLENQITAGIKLIPLGQSEGQRLLFELASAIPDAVGQALGVPDDHIGYSCASITEASCRHETQYSRLYRS